MFPVIKRNNADDPRTERKAHRSSIIRLKEAEEYLVKVTEQGQKDEVQRQLNIKKDNDAIEARKMQSAVSEVSARNANKQSLLF